MVGLGFGHACGHRAHADFRHQLDRDRRTVVDVLQVVDQLGQILDRVDVMVGRGRNQPDARHRAAQLGDVLGDLVAGQLAALAGLGALGHLDLDLVGAREVFGAHAETARGHLFDARAHGVARL